MPGNEFGDRVHNFFASESPLQGQPQSQVVEGNWPVLNNNLWVGSQRQTDVVNLNAKNYNPQYTDIDRGQGGYAFYATHGLNFTQSNLRADFGKSQSPNNQSNLNGYMYGNQFHPSRQNEVNFPVMEIDSEQHHLINSRSLRCHELQQGSGIEYQAKASVRSEAMVPSVSFDLFGGQQQMTHHQSSMLQPIQHQDSGINKQQQQQVIIRKIHDLQRQQQFQPLDLRQQNLISHVPSFTKLTSSGHSSSALIGDNTFSGSLQYPVTVETGTNWLNRDSSTMQGSTSGIVFPPKLGQAQHLVGLVPQQVDQSFYGLPSSGSRSLTASQCSDQQTDRSPMLQISTSTNNIQSNYNLLPDQVGVQDGNSVSREKYGNMFGHASNQFINAGTSDVGGLQQVDSIQRNAPQDFLGNQELTLRAATSSEKSMRQVALLRDEVALDPDEEKILFGSDDNIWAAFGNSPNIGGESCNLLDNGELNGFPSIQSGSWSALMQSAVAETPSSDIARPQEEWSGLMFNNLDGSAANQSLSTQNDDVKLQTSLANCNMQMHSALSPRSVPLRNDTSPNDVVGLNLLGHKFQTQPDRGLPYDMSHRFVSLEEGDKWSNYSPVQKSVSGPSQMYGKTSQQSFEDEKNAMKTSSPWAHMHSVAQKNSNERNATAAAITPGENRLLNVHETGSLCHNSQNIQVFQGEAVNKSSLWKLTSVDDSAAHLDPANSMIGNPEANTEALTSSHSPVPYPGSVGDANESFSFIQNNNILNQWKNANPSAFSQGGENFGRMMHQAIEQNQGLDSFSRCDKDEVPRYELENNDMKENSNDSHHSNLAWHTSTGHKETGLLDANASRSLLPTKLKSTNQLSRKVSAPRKFQFHPMGNLDEEAEPSHSLKPNHMQAMPQKNSPFDQSNFLAQFPKNSRGQSSNLQKHDKSSNEEPSHGSFVGYTPNTSVPLSRHLDLHTQEKASLSGQNMLELLPKVDKSRNHSEVMPITSFECNVSTQLSESEKLEWSVNDHRKIQSSVSQGFGLQLGPPSLQRLQIPDHPQTAQETVNLISISHAASEMGEKGQEMVPTSLVQSPCFLNGELQPDIKDKGSTVPLPRHAVNDQALKDFNSTVNSDSPLVIPFQNQQMMRQSAKIINQNNDSSLSSDALSYMQKVPDAPGTIRKANLVKDVDADKQSGHYDEHERVQPSYASAKDSANDSHHCSVDVSHQKQGGSINLLQNMGTNVPMHQDNSSVEYQKSISQFSELSQSNILKSSSFPFDGDEGGTIPSELSSIYIGSSSVDAKQQCVTDSSGHILPSDNFDTVPNMEGTLAITSSKNLSNSSGVTFSTTQNAAEDLSRSVNPNVFSHPSCELPNQMRGLNDSDTDLSSRASKRMKGPDNILNVDRVGILARQQNENSFVAEVSVDSNTGIPTEDYRSLSFPCSAETLQIQASGCENVATQETLAHGGNLPHNNTFTDYTASVITEYPNVNSLMAPSWFNQYGYLNDGQKLNQHDAHKQIPLRLGEVPFTPSKSLSTMDSNNSEEKGTVAPTGEAQVGNNREISTPTLVSNEHLSSPSQLNATDQQPVILSSKKRKDGTYDLDPCHKEISDGSQNLWTLSAAEAEWNKVTNRLPEKLDYDVELIEDGQPLLRSKRRLILTTQLMQQLFYPPPGNILSSNASSNCESVINAISRTVLRDACDIVSCSSGLNLRSDRMESHFSKGKASDKSGGRGSGKVIEELMGMSLKLENDFARLDKNSSIFDLRMECQDLDKFSIINRLAKFHGRGHAETGPTQKPLPQRYATALPMPKILPDGVQCLSLP